MTHAIEKSLSSLSRRQKKKIGDAKAVYRALLDKMALLAPDESLGDDDLASLQECVDVLDYEPGDIAQDARDVRSVLIREDQVATARAMRDELPTRGELDAKLRAMDVELAAQINQLLQPKRQLEQLLEQRRAAELAVVHNQNQLDDLKSRRPSLFMS